MRRYWPIMGVATLSLLATAPSARAQHRLPHGHGPHTPQSILTNAPGTCDVGSLQQILAFSSTTARATPVTCNADGVRAARNDPRLPFLMTENCDRQLTRACARAAASSLTVDEEKFWPCRGGDNPLVEGQTDGFYQHVRYHLDADGDRITVGLKVRLNIVAATAARKAEMLRRSRECIPSLAQVWARYGITFDLSLDSTDAPTSGDPDHSVTLDDALAPDASGEAAHRRSNAGYYYYNGLTGGKADQCLQCGVTVDCVEERDCEPVRQNEYCLLLLHETGHLVGLPDEYEEKESSGENHCPLRATEHHDSEPFSVMDQQDKGWDHIELFPRHIQAVTRPLCPNTTR